MSVHDRKNLKSALESAILYLQKQGVEEARQDAWLLLEHVCGISHSTYFVHSEDEMPKEQQLQIIIDSGIILDNVQLHAPKLWHGMSGSIVVRDELGIDDEDILNAIRYHTTGRAGMSLLEKIIFTADFTSEERTYSGVATMRKKSKKSLEEAMLYGYQFTFKDLSKRQLAIHPDEVACYNEIVLQISQTKGKNK